MWFFVSFYFNLNNNNTYILSPKKSRIFATPNFFQYQISQDNPSELLRVHLDNSKEAISTGH